jgi:hypothetical protein
VPERDAIAQWFSARRISRKVADQAIALWLSARRASRGARRERSLAGLVARTGGEPCLHISA